MSPDDVRLLVTELGAVRTACALRTGRLDPVEVCRALLAAAPAATAAHALLTTTTQRALREAEASRERHRSGRAHGDLDGVPVVWKDLFDLAGTVTTAGSASRIGAPTATADATVVRTLAEAGAVCLGKTNLSEFAFSGLGINRRFGTPVNPLDPTRVPGGSSSGSAVAVAMGLAPLAIGTDTSGSVRVPAAFCGLVGFKASPGRYDTAGMLPLAPTLDSVGVLARRVADVLAADTALKGTPRPFGPATDGLRVVVPFGELVEDCAPTVAAGFGDAVDSLAAAGIRVETRRLASLDRAQRLMDEHGTLVVAEAYQRYGHLLSGPAHGVDPAVLRRLATFDPAGRSGVILRRELPVLREQVSSELDGAVLAYPTVRDPAPALAPLLADEGRYDAANRRVLRSTMLTSYLGMPGVSLPHAGGSILLSTPIGEDADALAAAGAAEAVLGRQRG
ncbi:aspartyl-tRNA(Asn)/glutamyl-tRNA(Gln) amidotransferase subunit A [Amycolatopsis marina]|uniref:Aspartyl-tRNA(Asn)/glutamyl-tRNA(Gln) amidotransferase subunit A n=1 Tax=Amycolatopsis marina TaxID=490629 RepID=A0A1I1B409_9PSEU|nr:amidase family protein [Amycolatopsis marina]SFB44386.1 aspartyl-tRNA(Asn)/glutamyl-tRNA(Gln) amidotransferase subunit A [Amycolatopsis marina]